MTALQTERLIIRRLTDDDAPFILTLLNEPSFLQYIGDKKVRNLDDARQYIRTGPAASYERHGFGLCLVQLKDTLTPIGMCGLLKRDELPDPDEPEITAPSCPRCHLRLFRTARQIREGEEHVCLPDSAAHLVRRSHPMFDGGE